MGRRTDAYLAAVLGFVGPCTPSTRVTSRNTCTHEVLSQHLVPTSTRGSGLLLAAVALIRQRLVPYRWPVTRAEQSSAAARHAALTLAINLPCCLCDCVHRVWRADPRVPIDGVGKATAGDAADTGCHLVWTELAVNGRPAQRVFANVVLLCRDVVGRRTVGLGCHRYDVLCQRAVRGFHRCQGATRVGFAISWDFKFWVPRSAPLACPVHVAEAARICRPTAAPRHRHWEPSYSYPRRCCLFLSSCPCLGCTRVTQPRETARG